MPALNPALPKVAFLRITPAPGLKRSLFLSDLNTAADRASVRNQTPTSAYVSNTEPFTDLLLTEAVLKSWYKGTIRGFLEQGLIEVEALQAEELATQAGAEVPASAKWVIADTSGGADVRTLPWPAPVGTSFTFLQPSASAFPVQIVANPEGGSLDQPSPLELTSQGQHVTLFLDEGGVWRSLAGPAPEVIPEDSNMSSFLPRVDVWVDNVAGADAPDRGSKAAPYATILYAMDQLKVLGVTALKVVNIKYTGTLYRDAIVCNTSYWHIRGVDNPASSGDNGGGLPRIGVRTPASGPFSTYPTVVVSNLTDAALATFFASPSFPMYTETDTTFDWTGPDLIGAGVQDATKVVQAAASTASMYVLVENLIISGFSTPSLLISGTDNPSSIAGMVLGKAPGYPAPLYGGLQEVSFRRLRSSGGLVLKNASNVTLDSSLDFGVLVADNCQPVTVINPRPLRGLKARLGNSNGAATNEVYLYDPATATNRPVLSTGGPLVITGSQSNTAVRGGPVKMVGGTNLSGLFVDSSFSTVQTGAAFFTPQTSYVGGWQALARTIQTNGLDPMVFDHVGHLTVAEQGAVQLRPCRIAGNLLMTTSRPCLFSRGNITGTVALNGTGNHLFESIIFDTLVVVNAGTHTFRDCTFRSGITVNGGVVNLFGGTVNGTGTRTAGTANSTLTLFSAAPVGTWTRVLPA
jgi:hypothetical protein